ncbi:methyl-accepting chemotaxis protein [Aeromonas caviae]|uniref:methyl-accepting chemotaxis protein n=1 Tax=Aeromonas TaxID=642 RepID=UPI00191D8559|nr:MULTISPECIES: methyl-accepting chemotaxis protein [Aeromonas]MBL0486480.1 methyl-accepting chemotaxis protein [Aeromonas caviae]MBL0551009.1 methyl-accepting chemotaxis protein [Aeromonas caviae]MCU7795341.1 methyl-accepting chemotaxis protein [Aeromonas caviae]MDU7779179.1 methyl-accepting chemotaxis protein [Aeromonas caviae]WAF58780.1 methyl-accepting chemotaxis protein [Aeromonas caviae]
MSYKHLSIGKKIAAVFAVIAVISAVFGLFLATELRDIRDRVLNFTDSTLPSVLSVDNLLYDVSYVRRAQFALLMVEDAVDRQVRRARIQESLGKVQQVMDAYEATVGAEHERQAFNRVKQQWLQYLGAVNQVDALLFQGSRDEAREALFRSNGLYTELELAVRALVKVNLGFVEENRGSLLGSVTMVMTFAVVSIATLLIFMGVMTWFLTRQICLPLQAVVAQANAIALGDLTHRLDRQHIGQDELGMLASASLKMQDNLRGLIEEVAAAVTQLGAAIEEVSAVSEQSSQGIQSQQQEIAQVATAMAQMKATVADVAGNTEVASESASSANALARRGSQDVQGALDAITRVASEMEQAGNLVSELEKESAQINLVVDVIRGIADQTNLLALNAAIEAARAGEQGRGFAVVADEVRTLAGRTQASTGEIVAIIETLQARANRAKSVTGQSCEMIRQCVSQSERTSVGIRQIEEAVAQIADMAIQIASACGEQDAVSDELGRNVARINDSSNEVATGADHTAKACLELSQLAAGLRQSMGRFRLA